MAGHHAMKVQHHADPRGTQTARLAINQVSGTHPAQAQESLRRRQSAPSSHNCARMSKPGCMSPGNAGPIPEEREIVLWRGNTGGLVSIVLRPNGVTSPVTTLARQTLFTKQRRMPKLGRVLGRWCP